MSLKYITIYDDILRGSDLELCDHKLKHEADHPVDTALHAETSENEECMTW